MIDIAAYVNRKKKAVLVDDPVLAGLVKLRNFHEVVAKFDRG
jgi:hypothetical protein